MVVKTVLGSHFGGFSVNSPPILEPILVVGLGRSLGANRSLDFDPWPGEDPPEVQRHALRLRALRGPERRGAGPGRAAGGALHGEVRGAHGHEAARGDGLRRRAVKVMRREKDQELCDLPKDPLNFFLGGSPGSFEQAVLTNFDGRQVGFCTASCSSRRREACKTPPRENICHLDLPGRSLSSASAHMAAESIRSKHAVQAHKAPRNPCRTSVMREAE